MTQVASYNRQPKQNFPGLKTLKREIRGKSFKESCAIITNKWGIHQLFKAVKLGENWAIQLAMEHAYGKPKQVIEQLNVNLDLTTWSEAQLTAFQEDNILPQSTTTALNQVKAKAIPQKAESSK